MINPPTSDYPFPSLTIDVPLLLLIEQHLNDNGCSYGLGDKAPSLDCDTSEIEAIDCSGFFRYALARAAGTVFPDGSVQQHDFVIAHGFKISTVAAAKADDGGVRAAFLTPADGGGVGHVVLIHGGYTIESHGGVGPDRRPWNPMAYPFFNKMSVYVLSPPSG